MKTVTTKFPTTLEMTGTLGKPFAYEYENFSSYLQDLKPTFDLTEDPISAFKSFQHFVNLVSSLGNLEHSGDWDLYLVFTTRDGKQITSAQGYEESELNGNLLTITIEDPDDEDETIEATFDIYTFKSVYLER